MLIALVYTIVDSFGVDDGFMVGLVYSFFEGYSFCDSVCFAVVCAVILCVSGSLNNFILFVDNVFLLVLMV